MSRQAEWFFDVISPYAYLQSRRLSELPSDVEVTFRPVLFAGLLNHWGQLGPAEIPEKRRHTGMVTRWRARQLGIPFKGPPRHPFNPLALLRLILSLDARPDVVHAVFAHVWAEGEDGQAPESLARLAAKLGVDDLEARISDPSVKAALQANTEAAVAKGVFGVPSFLIAGEVFWGDDAFDLMRAWLDDPAAVFDAEHARMMKIRPAVERRRPAPAAPPRAEEGRAAGWSIHHVNLPASDVRASARFYTEILGLKEVPWTFPPAAEVGHISADPAKLTLFASDTASRGANSGLHLIQPEPAFARENGLDHNPSIGGHVAIQVPDLDVVMARLDTAGIAYSYAPTYAIPGMRHIYVYDPGMNLLEINEMLE